MVSIFYGSTFLHRSQLLCIINRALHPFARATHPLSPSPPLLLPASFILPRRRGQSYESNNPPPRVKWISIDSKHSLPPSSSTWFLSLFPSLLPSFFFSNIENRLCIANLIRVIANAQSIERPWEIPFAYTIGITV